MHAGSCRCRSLFEAKHVPVTSVSLPTGSAISGLQLRCQAWLWQPDQEGIVTCAGGTGLAVWPVVKTLWWRVYRVLTSCHVQLPQLRPVLISCCSRWINKGDMTQTNISTFVWLRFLVLEKQNIPRVFFFSLSFPACHLAAEQNAFSSLSESKILQFETFFSECALGKKKTLEKKIQRSSRGSVFFFLTRKRQPAHFSLR